MTGPAVDDIDPFSFDHSWTAEEIAAGDGARAEQASIAGLYDAEAEAETPDTWEAPVPLDTDSVPPFPVAALPSVLGAFVRGVAEFAEVPLDLPGVLTLAVVSAAVARKVRLAVREKYVEPLNLFTVTAMAPGERKSAIFADVTAPLVAFERELLDSMGPEIAEAQSQARVREKELARAEAMAARGGPEAMQWGNARRELARAIRETLVPTDPRVLMADATPEAIAVGLAEQGGRLSVFSPEADTFSLLTRYAKDGSPNFEVFLKAHAGDELRVDRRHAPPVTVASPALTVGLTVQPAVLRGLAADRMFRERGLLARFLFAVPSSVIGHRTFAGAPVPEPARAQYTAAMRWLCRCPVQAAPLALTAEAYATWHAFALDVERRRRADGSFAGLLDWSGKLPGLVARLAGVLHLAAAAAAEQINPAVDHDTMRRAVQLGEYAAAHAIAAFAMMGADPAVSGARILFDWLGRRQLRTFTKRDAHAGNRAAFARSADLSGPLAELCERGWIRPALAEHRNGRPSELYAVHPDLCAGDARE